MHVTVTFPRKEKSLFIDCKLSTNNMKRRIINRPQLNNKVLNLVLNFEGEIYLGIHTINIPWKIYQFTTVNEY